MVADPVKIRLRPFPYPYRAALAICSDIDSCDRATFVAVHRFLNDPHQGLGLPVADSCFALGREPGQMAYFLADGRTAGPDANFILEAIGAGLIDSLHSWGDFNDIPPDPQVLRQTAELFTDHLQSRGLGIKVWINHGSPSNRQNLRARLQPQYQGDDPGSPFYTGDLVKRMGIKFYWWSEIEPWPLSGRRFWSQPRSWLRLGQNSLKNYLKWLAGYRHRMKSSGQIMNLCQSIRLGDGSRLLAFSRFNRHPQGLWGQPTRHTWRYAVSPEVLRELVDQEGFLILYTHLGQPRDSGGELFPDPDRAALHHLAEHFHGGRIWMATTRQLLTYWLLTRGLRWRVSQEGGRIIIDLEALDDPTTGPRPPAREELAGLGFYSPRPEATVIRRQGQTLAAQIFPPDHTGVGCLGLAPPPPPALDLLGG